MKIFSPIKVLFLMMILSAVAYGQVTLQGIVTDSLTQEPLIGASVFISGTSLGAATNLEGEYKIQNIPEGTYKVKISYIGYVTKIESVTLKGNKAIDLFFQLSTGVIEGKTIVVTSQAFGQTAAINQQLNSNTIVNIVSEQKIKELPDANAAEAIGRLPGVSLIRSGGEANKIILRGLSDKYTSVTMDGVKIPSTDALERGLDLSTISQSSLSGIELYKALTSDQDGDAIAGSVNLVTKKAPLEREIQATFKGGYNHIMKSFEEYDFSLRYGERFFDNLLGVQVIGNLENKIRSKERYSISYDQSENQSTSYYINNFTLDFTDEVRKRNGISLLLDFNTPDNGSIKLNTFYNSTNRDYLESTRDYPNGGGNTQYTGGVSYSYRDREQDIKTFSSSLSGENNLLGFSFNWGLSYAQSKTNFPYDYNMDFTETSSTGIAGMRAGAGKYKDNPGQLIPFAYNNFTAASLSGATYNTQDNMDKDKAAFLNIIKDYFLSDKISGTLKGGFKYKAKDRTNSNTSRWAPYYLGYFKGYQRLADGSIVEKDLAGSYFDAFYQEYLKNPNHSAVSFSQFLDANPESRELFDEYSLNPLINRDRLRQWYELNKNGVDKTGVATEYYDDPSVKAYYYDITETVTSGYLMNTLNIGQDITFIAGLRVENEDNHYNNKYSKTDLSGFPVPMDRTRDTTADYSETIYLPNFQLRFKATDFLNIRLAAYKALARPDFNMRLNTYFAWRPSDVGSNKQLILGNPILKTAKAWNFEINTSFYGNNIGLISISAFYKEIEDMYHMLNQINTTGDVLMERLGLAAKTIHSGTYQLTVPYNSPKPSKVWGLEFEHQINFTFLPGWLQNFVLSYNFSIVRSETWLIGARTDTAWVIKPPFTFPQPVYSQSAYDYKQQLEEQPEFYGNVSLGYDIAGFSIRLSMFHQSEYNVSFSSTGRSDNVKGAYTRFDVAVKQKINNNLSLQLNVNNLTNIKEDNYLEDRVNGYKILRSSELYGLSAELGVRVDL